jgi:hypothetical protein
MHLCLFDRVAGKEAETRAECTRVEDGAVRKDGRDSLGNERMVGFEPELLEGDDVVCGRGVENAVGDGGDAC